MKNLIGLIICLTILYFLFPNDKSEESPISVSECLEFIKVNPYKWRAEIRTGYKIQPIKLVDSNGIEFELNLERNSLTQMTITPIKETKLSNKDKITFYFEDGKKIIFEDFMSTYSGKYFINLKQFVYLDSNKKDKNYLRLKRYLINQIEIQNQSKKIKFDLSKEDSEILKKTFNCFSNL